MRSVNPQNLTSFQPWARTVVKRQKVGRQAQQNTEAHLQSRCLYLRTSLSCSSILDLPFASGNPNIHSSLALNPRH